MELALTKLIGPGPISTVSQCMMDLMEVARAHDHVLLLLIPLETLLTMMRPPRSICSWDSSLLGREVDPPPSCARAPSIPRPAPSRIKQKQRLGSQEDLG